MSRIRLNVTVDADRLRDARALGKWATDGEKIVDAWGDVAAFRESAARS